MTVDVLVIGLGYVGLPLAREAVLSGLRVVGYDLKPELVAGLNEGRSHVDDISDASVREMLERVSASRLEKMGWEGRIPSLSASRRRSQRIACLT